MDVKVYPMRKQILSAATALIAICSASVAFAEQDDFVENTAILNWDPYTDQAYTGDVALDQALAYDRALCHAMLSKSTNRSSSSTTTTNVKTQRTAGADRINGTGETSQTRRVVAENPRELFEDCLEARGWFFKRDPKWHDGIANYRTPEENPIFLHGKTLDVAKNGYMIYPTDKAPQVWTYRRPEPAVGVQLNVQPRVIVDFKNDHTGQTYMPGYTNKYTIPYSAAQASANGSGTVSASGSLTTTVTSTTPSSVVMDEQTYHETYNAHSGRDISIPVTGEDPKRTPYN